MCHRDASPPGALAQHAQMRAGVSDGRRHLFGERFDGFLALTEQVEKLDWTTVKRTYSG